MRFTPLLLILLFSCNNKPDTQLEIRRLISTDSAFSETSRQLGMKQAFLLYSDSSVIELNEGGYPTQGITEMKYRLEEVDDSQFQFIWQPLKGEVSKCGDLGYIFGNWEILVKNTAGKDSATYGNYITVWKKNSRNEWKVVLDGGNSAPGPSSLR